MPSLDSAVIALAGITLFAAFVNGALGYGFSSLTVPVALVFYANRVLNPAVVVIEVLINFYVLFINLNGVPAVWKRVFPIVIGLFMLSLPTATEPPCADVTFHLSIFNQIVNILGTDRSAPISKYRRSLKLNSLTR